MLKNESGKNTGTLENDLINSISATKAGSISIRANDIIASVVIPTLNPDERLSKCLSFLEKQSEKRFEVIIINNGSDYNFLSLNHNIECYFLLLLLLSIQYLKDVPRILTHIAI